MLLCSDEAKFVIKIAVENSFQRDIMAMLIRQIVTKYKEAPDKIREMSEKDFFKKKEEMWSKEVSKLTKKL